MILYVSKLFGDGDFGADQHYQAICEIYGEENVFTIDLSPHTPYRKERYIAYGKCRSPLHRIGRWFQGNMQYISSRIISEILIFIEKNQITDVFIEDSVFGNLVYQIKKRYPEVRIICFYHDIKYVLYSEWGKKLPLYNKIELQIGRLQEKKSQQYSDVELVLNQREAGLYKQVYGRMPDGVIPLSAPDHMQFILKENNGNIFCADKMQANIVIQETEKHRRKVILFVGKKYYPNIDGIRWFMKNVMPELESSAELWIVGRGLEFLRNEITSPRIKVIGSVDTLDLYYWEADLVIAPLFEGGGMKLKTLEALSFGKRMIGTPESMVGVWEMIPDDMKRDSLFCSENAEEWIEWIGRDLKENKEKFSQKVHQLFQSEFSYPVMKRKLENILERK